MGRGGQREGGRSTATNNKLYHHLNSFQSKVPIFSFKKKKFGMKKGDNKIMRRFFGALKTFFFKVVFFLDFSFFLLFLF